MLFVASRTALRASRVLSRPARLAVVAAPTRSSFRPEVARYVSSTAVVRQEPVATNQTEVEGSTEGYKVDEDGSAAAAEQYDDNDVEEEDEEDLDEDEDEDLDEDEEDEDLDEEDAEDDEDADELEEGDEEDDDVELDGEEDTSGALDSSEALASFQGLAADFAVALEDQVDQVEGAVDLYPVHDMSADDGEVWDVDFDDGTTQSVSVPTAANDQADFFSRVIDYLGEHDQADLAYALTLDEADLSDEQRQERLQAWEAALASIAATDKGRALVQQFSSNLRAALDDVEDDADDHDEVGAYDDADEDGDVEEYDDADDHDEVEAADDADEVEEHDDESAELDEVDDDEADVEEDDDISDETYVGTHRLLDWVDERMEAATAGATSSEQAEGPRETLTSNESGGLLVLGGILGGGFLLGQTVKSRTKGKAGTHAGAAAH